MVISGQAELSRLDDKCYDLLQLGHRPNTRRHKRTHANLYQRFCDEYNLPEMPADEWQLCRYAAYTADRTNVNAVGTVSNYVSGVRSLQALAGYPSPLMGSPNMKLMMEGIKAYLAQPVKQASPMNLEILTEIYQVVDFDNPFQFCVYACILTGFYLILRISNLVPSSTNNFNPREQFTRWHVGLDQDGKLAVFLIEWSKTVQHCQKEMWVPVMPAQDPRICLLEVLKYYFKIVPAPETAPCFCYHNKCKQCRALMYSQADVQLKEWIKKVGTDETGFTLHCLHRGGTTHAFEMGIKPEYIKMMGDWASQCFFRYLDIALDNRLRAVIKFTKRK